MSKVVVHHFKVWDISAQDWYLEPRKTTADRIEDLPRAEIIPGTAEEVDEAELDEYERYIRSRREDGTLS